MSNATKGKIIKTIALILDVGGPLIATIICFPVWIERSPGATISGIAILGILLSVIPVFNLIRKKAWTPSAWLIWVLLCAFFMILKAIINEMAIVSIVGAASNIIGAFIYMFGDKISKPKISRGKGAEDEYN